MASAGHYDVTYSTGQLVRIVGPDGIPWTEPYDTLTASRAGAGYSHNKPTGGLGTPAASGTVDLDDDIVVTLSWNRDGVPVGNPAGDAPSYLVVKEEASAVWSGDSGYCGNGLGDPEQSNPDDASGYSTGVHYLLFSNPGNTKTITLTPYAHGAGTAPPTHSTLCASGSVYVKFTPYVIGIQLTGTVSTSDSHILVGQNLGAYLTAGGTQIGTSGGLPLGGTTSTYDWAVGGGEPFQDFLVHVNSGSPDSAEVVPFNNQHTSSLSTYLKARGVFTVSCSFYWPLMASTLYLTASGTSERPKIENVDASITPPDFLPNASSPSAVRLFDPVAGIPGIVFYAQITIPSRYSTSGKWNYTQLIAPNRYQDSEVPHDLRFSPNMAVNGVEGLDSSFPYLTAIGSGVYYDPSIDFPTLSSVLTQDDSPTQMVGTTSAQVYDSFQTYILFKPNGGKYVSLKNLQWNWNAAVSKSAPNRLWSIRSSNQFGFMDTTTHPTWWVRQDKDYWDFR